MHNKYLIKTTYKNNVKGFTLVELAIVVVIIGLIVAGVTTGQSLVKQAQLRSITTDVKKFSVAIKAFRLKYDAIPGDMTDAFSYWGSGSCTDTTSTNTNTTNVSCNGNGDKQIVQSIGEGVKAWFHMSQAGVLSEGYSGLFTVNGEEGAGNSPAASYLDGGYYLNNWWPPLGVKKIYVMFGGRQPALAAGVLILSPAQTFDIDTKIDDGAAALGRVSGGDPSGNPGSCYLGTAYILTNTATNLCRIGFLIR